MILVVALVVSGCLTGYVVRPRLQYGQDIFSTMFMTKSLTDAPVPRDMVTVTIHDKDGNLVAKETANNIITTAGAAFYCIQAGLCAGGASGAIENPNISAITTPEYWISFINGTGANTNEPTAADCSVSSSSQLVGQTSGTGTSTTCIVNFGSAPAQYPSDSNNFLVPLCVSATSCSGDLRASSGIVDSATGDHTLATQLFSGCSPSSNGTAPSSGTCINDQQTSVFANNIDQKLNIVGLALFGGSTGKTAATGQGPLIIAEASLSPAISLNPGDTIQVTWQITV